MQATISISPELSLRPLAALVTHAAMVEDLGLDDLEIFTLAAVELAESLRVPGVALTAEVVVSSAEVRVSVRVAPDQEIPQARAVPLVAAGFSSLRRQERGPEVWITAAAHPGRLIA